VLHLDVLPFAGFKHCCARCKYSASVAVRACTVAAGTVVLPLTLDILLPTAVTHLTQILKEAIGTDVTRDILGQRTVDLGVYHNAHRHRSVVVSLCAWHYW
jgi:hypothetical protein